MNIFKKKKITNIEDKVPSKAEDVIPIREIYEDGITLCGRNTYAKTFRFTDINYETADYEEKEHLFLSYAEILNSLDEGAYAKITINNRQINKVKFEQKNMLSFEGNFLDKYRREYNNMLNKNAKMGAGIVQDKYLTITIEKKNYEEARVYFNRLEVEFRTLFSKLGSKITPVEREEKLKLLFDFFHYGNEDDFMYEESLFEKRGHSVKDIVSPHCFEFRSDYFKMDDRYARVLYLRDYGSFIKDSFIAELTDIDKGIMLSIDADPMRADEALRQGESKLLAVETNISNWQRKQNQNNNFSATVPYDMEKQREESREFVDDLVSRDQRMILGLITMVCTAISKEELDSITESIRLCARKNRCSLNVLRWQQIEGLNTVLPYGMPKLDIRRTLTTESLAVFMPFRVGEINHQNGIYFANNYISKNLIMINREELLNGNSFITGVSGSGKSMLAKQEIISLYLADKNADIIVIDPENEYQKMVSALGGENIEISATSKHHINPMDINMNYADGQNPVILKSEFMLSLCEQAVGTLTAKQKSIIDRLSATLLNDYMLKGFNGEVPTLKDFHEQLKLQPESEAKDIALSLELFTKGSLDIFAKQTNVDTSNRFLCYDIHKLGSSLLPVGMLVVLDNILNRITTNKAKGRKTYIFIDEIYLMFKHDYSADFLFTMWKRIRKYGAFITGITQNTEDLLQSHVARTMLANSELVIMLNQAATDREELRGLLNISASQMAHITNTEAGRGLAKIGATIVPFINKMDKKTELYELITTKANEKF